MSRSTPALLLCWRRRWRRGHGRGRGNRLRRTHAWWGRRWGWCPVPPPRGLRDARDLVPLRVHALLICHVVPSLRLPPVCVAGVCPHDRSAEEAASCSDRRASARVAGGRADGGAQPCPEKRSDGGGASRVLIHAIRTRCPGLLSRPLPADRVIGLEYLEGLPGSRQHHHAWSGWNECTSAQRHESDKSDDTPFSQHSVFPPSVQVEPTEGQPSSIRLDTAGRTGNTPVGSGNNTSNTVPGAGAPAEHRPVAPVQRPREGPNNMGMEAPTNLAPTNLAPTKSARQCRCPRGLRHVRHVERRRDVLGRRPMRHSAKRWREAWPLPEKSYR